MHSHFFLSVLASTAWAQQPTVPAIPSYPRDKVVAEYGDGQKLTWGEVESFVNGLTPQMKNNALRDRKQLVQQ
jgi:hypothetical protein